MPGSTSLRLWGPGPLPHMVFPISMGSDPPQLSGARGVRDHKREENVFEEENRWEMG